MIPRRYSQDGQHSIQWCRIPLIKRHRIRAPSTAPAHPTSFCNGAEECGFSCKCAYWSEKSLDRASRGRWFVVDDYPAGSRHSSAGISPGRGFDSRTLWLQIASSQFLLWRMDSATAFTVQSLQKGVWSCFKRAISSSISFAFSF